MAYALTAVFLAAMGFRAYILWTGRFASWGFIATLVGLSSVFVACILLDGMWK